MQKAKLTQIDSGLGKISSHLATPLKTFVANFAVKKYGIAVLLVFSLLLIGVTGFLWYQLSLVRQNPEAVSAREINDIVKRLGRLIVLPDGEQPTVATVSDPERLKDQPFFVKAKKGDKVLIYTNARKAILYDPIADKIVEVAPLNIGQQ